MQERVVVGLEAINLEAGYRGRAVVRGVSCAVGAGVVTALVGPNGAGKSTLVRALVGVLAPMGGRVELDGVAMARVAVRERARRVALIPQVSGEGRGFSAMQTVRLGRLAMRESVEKTEAMAWGALERVGLADRADEALGALSVGQQQRVLVARAVAQLGLMQAGAGSGGPGCPARDGGIGGWPTACADDSVDAGNGTYLLADEPIAAMDPEHALRTMSILGDAARRGVGVLVVLHDFALAARFADRVLLMDGQGRIAASGATAEVLAAENLEGVFGARFRMVEDAGGVVRFAVAVEAGDSI